MDKDIPDPIPAKFLDIYPPPQKPADDFPEGKDILDYDPIPVSDSPVCDYILEGIPVKPENKAQCELYWKYSWEQRRIQQDAIFQYFFPEITEAQKMKILVRQSISREDSIETVCEKVRAYYLKVLDDEKKKAEQAKLIEQAIAAGAARGRKPRKGKKHKCKSGELDKIHAKFVELRGNDAPHKNTIANWIHGKTTPPAGFLTALKSKEPFALEQWMKFTYEKPERRRAGKPIGSMTDEEIYRDQEK